jgi:hypothetical protein
MLWIGVWSVVALIGLLGTVAAINSRRFAARVARETMELWQDGGAPRPLDRSALEGLPAPVRRYLSKALGRRERALQSARLRHSGTFRTTLDGDWFPIRGEQYFSTDAPAFVWWGRVHIAPGLWIDARDRSIAGAGGMLVLLESSVTLADSSGPELDQGALLRLLGELTWLPSALLDARFVTWSAIDDYKALATLRVGGREVSGVFEFGTDDLPRSFSAERQRAIGRGRSVLTRFTGECRAYREVDGMLVPGQMIAYWHVDGQRIPYARFHVERLEYDVAAALSERRQAPAAISLVQSQR